MLRINCPKCDGIIKSPFLAELESVECSSCKEDVTIQGIVVETKAFTMQRKDLLNRISHYKGLLREVEKEREKAGKKGVVSKKPKKKTADLRSTLKDLLLAARDHYRLEIPYALYIEMNCGDNKRLSRLKNLSSKGACVEFKERGRLPLSKSKIIRNFLLPAYPKPLSLPATVVWVKKLTDDMNSEYVNVGLQFKGLEEKLRSCIWGFIVDTALDPSAPGPLRPALNES